MAAWNRAKKGEVNKSALPYVQAVEQTQFETFDRFEKLACLYDPSDRSRTYTRQTGPEAQVVTNVIASNVDTVTAAISSTDVRCRFMTDDAEFSVQRQAVHLEWYSDGLTKKFKVHKQARRAFKEASLKGTGLIKVFEGQHGQICVEHVLVDDIIVDNAETRTVDPQQMHHRMFVDKRVLAANFPQHKVAIEKAREDYDYERRGDWAGYRPVDSGEVVVIESWYLPLGIKGRDGYEPGRHAICIEGVDLFDEEWHKVRFPFAVMRWSERTRGFYGIGGAERIAGHQRAINRLNWQIDHQINQHAVPTTYIDQQDASASIKTTNRAGTFIAISGRIPKTVIPSSVAPEQFARLQRIEAASYEEFGVSRMAATAAKPGGLDSGVALREYRDQTTQRFALQEKDFEQLVLDVVWLMLDVCKDLGEDAPTVQRKTRYGKNKFKWSDVDMGEIELQLEAASNMSKTPAGRTQLVMEYAQAGIITQDEARNLMGHPDVASAMSLYTAGQQNIDMRIEAILDGATGLVPGPHTPLKIGVWRFEQSYLKADNDNAPESVLEELRSWSSTAAFMLSEQERKQQEQLMAAQQAAAPQQPAGPPAQAPFVPQVV